MTAEDFRRLVLALPGAVEGAHMGHPDFRANGRIFASLHSGDRTGMVKLTPDEQREYLREYPDMFTPSAGAWGRQGCTNVILEAAREGAVRGALTLAWERVAAQPARRSKRGQNAQPAPKKAQREEREETLTTGFHRATPK